MPTFSTPDPIAASIDVAVGGVHVVASPDPGETVVTVRPSDPAKPDDVAAAEATRVDFAGGALHVKGRRPGLRSIVTRDRGAIDLTVALPAGSTVDGHTGWGDFDVEGELGDCRVKVGLGHIRIAAARAVTAKTGLGDVAVELASELEAQTGSGDVRVCTVAGEARVKSANGDITVGVAGGELRLTTANGSLAVDRAGGGVAAKSAFGDVRLGALTRGEVVVESGAGDVELGIPEGTLAWLDVRSSAGRVENLLEAADAPPAGDEERVRVRARTAVGTITVRRP